MVREALLVREAPPVAESARNSSCDDDVVPPAAPQAVADSTSDV